MIRSPRWANAALAALFLLLLLPPAAARSIEQGFSVASPDGSIEATFRLEGGKPLYSIMRHGEPLLRSSKLGFQLADAPNFDGDFVVAATHDRTVDETWEQPWGDKRVVRCNFNELRIDL